MHLLPHSLLQVPKWATFQIYKLNLGIYCSQIENLSNHKSPKTSSNAAIPCCLTTVFRFNATPEAYNQKNNRPENHRASFQGCILVGTCFTGISWRGTGKHGSARNYTSWLIIGGLMLWQTTSTFSNFPCKIWYYISQ